MSETISDDFRAAGNSPYPRMRLVVATLLIVVTLLGIVLGTWISQSIRQRNAIAALTKAGNANSVQYDYELNSDDEVVGGRPPGPAWLREMLGVDFLATARGMELHEGTEEEFALLKDLPGLRVVRSTSLMDISDAGIAHLTELPSLRTVELHGRLTDGALACLAKTPSLRRLQISGRITSSCIKQLAGLPRLQRLALELGGDFADAALSPLHQFPALAELELSYVTDSTGAELRYLSSLKHLVSLSIFDCGDENTKLSNLPILPSMRRLTLMGCGSPPAGWLSALGQLPNLEALAMELPRDISTAAIELRERLPRLTKITLYQGADPLTDSALKNLARITQLRSLELHDAGNATDAGLSHLADLPNLEHLLIETQERDQFSAAALVALQRSLPKCRIDISVMPRTSF